MKARMYRMLQRRCERTGASLEGCLQELAHMSPEQQCQELRRLKRMDDIQQHLDRTTPTTEEVLRELCPDWHSSSFFYRTLPAA